MDIVLERILSLIPKKENGDFVHGSKKEFCQKIDAPTNIVNAWVRGTNHSYRNYLYRIASEYDVSVEWLEGKTAKKNNHPAETGRVADKRTQRIFAFVDECSPEELSDLTKYIDFLETRRTAK